MVDKKKGATDLTEDYGERVGKVVLSCRIVWRFPKACSDESDLFQFCDRSHVILIARGRRRSSGARFCLDGRQEAIIVQAPGAHRGAVMDMKVVDNVLGGSKAWSHEGWMAD